MASEEDSGGSTSAAQPTELYPPAEAYQTAWALYQSKEQQQSSASRAPTNTAAATAATQGSSSAATALQPRSDGPQQAVGTSGREGNSSAHVPSPHRPILAPWPLRILRSSQLDALRLDVELQTLLKEQLLRSLAFFDPGRISEWEPELMAALRLLVFAFSVLRGHATPGSQLLNLRYRSEPSYTPLRPSNPAPPSTQLTSPQPHATPAAAASASPSISSKVDTGPSSTASVAYGGRTGVEGPGLSVGQKVVLGLGMVIVPYVWSRVGTALARSATQQTVSWAEQLAQERQETAAETAATGTRARDHVSTTDDSKGSDTTGVQGSTGTQAGTQAALGVSDGGQGAQAGVGAGGGILRLALRRAYRVWARVWARVMAVYRTVREGTWRRPSAQQIWRVMQSVEGVYRGLAFANLLVFLSGGRYRSLLERLVGARLVYLQPVMTRIISFEYLNRQLVWQEISELLLFLLPLLDTLRLRRGAITRLLPRLPDPRTLLGLGGAAAAPAAQPATPPRTARAAQGTSPATPTQPPSAARDGGAGMGGDASLRASRRSLVSVRTRGALGEEGAEHSPIAQSVSSVGSPERDDPDTTKAQTSQPQQQQGQGGSEAVTPTAAAASASATAVAAAAGVLLSGSPARCRALGACPVCGQTDMLTPVVAVPCGHCFCYYCLASNTAADKRFECPKDGVRVAAYERWRPGLRLATPTPAVA